MKDNSPSMLMIVVGTIAVLGVGFVGYNFLFVPYRTNTFTIDQLEKDVDTKERDLKKFAFEKDRLATQWNQFSLPKTVEIAAAEYGNMLKLLLGRAGLTVDELKWTPPKEASALAGQKKTPQHQTLTFTVRAKGTLTALTKASEQLRQVPVMHRMKQIVIDKMDTKDKTSKLNVQMTIEAMIVAGTDNPQASLRPSADTKVKLKAMAPSERDFSDIPKRDPFLGYIPPPPPVIKPKEKEKEPEPDPLPTGPDPRLFVRVDTIESNGGEASLYDLNRTTPIRIKARAGYNIFRITDLEKDKMVMKGKVLRIDPRDVFFQVGNDVFAMHIGDTVAEAMKKPLDEEEVEALELTALIDADFAKETAGTGKWNGGPGKTSKKGNTKGPTTKGASRR